MISVEAAPVRLSMYSSVSERLGDSFRPSRLSQIPFRISYARSVKGMVR